VTPEDEPVLVFSPVAPGPAGDRSQVDADEPVQRFSLAPAAPSRQADPPAPGILSVALR
jgi:hypothetical protein